MAGLKLDFRLQPWHSGVIPEIDIWRPAQLMLKRYGERALEESAFEPTSSHPPVIMTA